MRSDTGRAGNLSQTALGPSHTGRHEPRFSLAISHRSLAPQELGSVMRNRTVEIAARRLCAQVSFLSSFLHLLQGC